MKEFDSNCEIYMIQIHPSAAKNFNKKAIELVKRIKEIPPEPNPVPKKFPSDVQIAASFDEKDIIGDVEVADSNYRGEIVNRYFYIDKKRFGLDKNNYKKLINIAENIQALPKVRDKLSFSFVEQSLFSWISDIYKNNSSLSFIENLEKKAEEIIRTVTLWVPIAYLEVQIPFSISNSEIRPLTKDVLDTWENKIKSSSEDDRKHVHELFNRIRKDFQGFAAVVITLQAEPKHAFDFAIENARQITQVLGIFSGALLFRDVKCASKIKGSENIEKATVLYEYNNDNMAMTSAIMDKSSARTWKLSQKEIIDIQQAGLNKISFLLTAEPINQFQKSVLNSILIYSKAAFTSDPIEKIVYILASIESILLKNENEPIQQNLAERLAIFSSKELDQRKLIIKTIKSVYGIRSRYLHHGSTSSDLALISDFMRYVWIFIIMLLSQVEKFDTKEEFLINIDDHKLT